MDTIKKVELKAEYFDLKTLPPSKSISFYEFQDKNNIGVGVLKQGYTFNLVSWIRAEDFGISCVFITSKSPEKMLLTTSKEEYIDFLSSELANIIPSVFKDKNIVNALLDAIKKPVNYDYYPETKNYILHAEHSDYDYIDISAKPMFFKDLYIKISAGGTDTSW